MADLLQTLIGLKAFLVFVWLAVFLGVERILPAAGRPDAWQWPDAARVWRNICLWLVASFVSFAFVLPLTHWASATVPGWATLWRFDRTNPGLALAFDILLLDGLIYWWHRANHRLPFLWRFHAVHHRDRFLDALSALRFHFGEVALSACIRAPVIWLLGFPLSSILIFETLLLLAAIFHHSNVALPARLERWLGAAIVTPSIHWVHHHAVRADTDSNYGTIFSFWDRLFGSRSPTQRWAAMPIGIEGLAEDAPIHRLLLQPFGRQKIDG